MSHFPLRLLDGLSEDILDLDEGQRLFSRGDPIRWLYIVRAGEVHLIRHLEAGQELVMSRSGPDSMVAEGSMFSDRYHCDAISMGPSRLSRFERGAVQARISADPDAIRAWSQWLTHSLQAARTRAEILSLKTVQERLEAWFALDPESEKSPSTWKSVANEIGVSPEALYRELARRKR
ncbi:Crp/Fnr family transcriptional regulator [Saccharospirillum salsuginis]|nr:Crp/Fnr family transcriptional regulator [Saccharospirillum salsuginis]